MLLEAKSEKVVTSGVVSQQTFSIKANGQAFSILSDKLYSNKPRAVIRELCCNAHDSHIAANKRDVPFEVHLPNQWEPWFEVKDVGVGLDHEDLLRLYTTYFESNKTQSAEATGGFGLGSKSPFCYTKSFNVTSVFNGVKRMYAAFLGEGYFPQISLMGEVATDEVNGLTVRVPVDRGDFHRFEDEASFVLAWFKVKPITNRQVHNPIKVIRTYGSFEMISGSQSYAVMSSVAYPISARIGDRAVVMYFQPNELEMAPSRESLSMGPKTETNLRTKTEQCRTEAAKEFREALAAKKSYLEALRYYNEHMTSFQAFNIRGEWNQLQLHSDFNLSVKFRELVVKGKTPGDQADVSKIANALIYRCSGGFKDKQYKVDKILSNNLSLDLVYDKVYEIGALAGRQFSARIRTLKNQGTRCIAIRFDGATHIKDQLTKFGVEVLDLNTVVADKVVVQRAKVERSICYQVYLNGRALEYTKVTDATLLTAVGTVYIEDVPGLTSEQIKEKLDFMSSVLPGTNVYRINSKKLAQTTGWVEAVQAAKLAYEAALVKAKMSLQDVSDYRTDISEIAVTNNGRLIVKLAKAHNLVHPAIQTMVRCSDAAKSKSIDGLESGFKHYVYLTKPVLKTTSVGTELRKSFPLIDYGYNKPTCSEEHMLAYLKMCIG